MSKKLIGEIRKTSGVSENAVTRVLSAMGKLSDSDVRSAITASVEVAGDLQAAVDKGSEQLGLNKSEATASSATASASNAAESATTASTTASTASTKKKD